MLIDDLPVYGRVGFHQQNTNNPKPFDEYHFLITHRHFNILYNKNQIIHVNISTRLQPGHYVELQKDQNLQKVHFTYSITWLPTDITYSKRFELIDSNHPLTSGQVEVHWLWILNTSLLVILLVGLLTMILLRTLKNDMARYLQIDELDGTSFIYKFNKMLFVLIN